MAERAVDKSRAVHDAMFSILMTGDDTEWNVPIGEQRRGSFALSRFLEYTNPAIEERFKPVSADTLRLLEQHPALFMSELVADRDNRHHGHVTMRVGRLTDITVADGRIAYNFIIDRDLGLIAVTDRGSLGSGLVDHSQKMTVAARATAEKKTVGHRS